MFSIELTPSNIHLVEVQKGGKTVVVKNVVSLSMPPGAYFNGYIKDITTVAKVIRDELLSRNIRNGKTYFMIDSSSVKMKEVVAPDENRVNVMSILNKEIADIIASEEHLLDYVTYGKYKEHGKTYMNCMLFAVPKHILNNYMALAEESGLHVVEIDLHSNVMEKLWELEEPSVKRSVPVKQKEQKLKKKNNEKHDNLESEDIDSDEEWNQQSLVPIKQKLQIWIGLYFDSIRFITNALDGNCYSKSVVMGNGNQTFESLDEEALKKHIIGYIDQVKSFLQFLSISNPQNRIEEIKVYGDFGDLKGFISILQKMVECPVDLLQIPKNIKGVQSEEYPVYCGAIGALLRR